MSGIMQLLLSGRPQVASDPYFEYTTLLLPGNGTNGAQNNTFLDSSTNNFTITRNGNTTQGTFSPFSQTGWGNYFDGTGDYLTFPNNTAFAFGTGAFTIEFWVNGPLNNDKFFLSGRAAIGTMHITTGGAGGSTAGALRYVGSSTITSGSVVVTNGTWNHCAIVRDGSNNITLYVNGTSVGTGTDTTNYTTTSGTWYIASNDVSAPANTLTAYLSNLRIVKGTAVYTANFTPPTTPLTAITNTSLLTCQSNRFIDNSTNNFAITRNGDVSVQAFSPFNPTAAWSAATNGGSGYFDGSGDYLSVADSSAFTLGSGDFTVECWVYRQVSGSRTFIYGQSTGADNINTSISAEVNASNKLVSYTCSGTTAYTATSTNDVPLNQWVHVAIVRNGTTVAQYINGAKDGEVSVSTSSVNDSGQIFGIGSLGSYVGLYWNGYIASFRLVKGTAVYTANFTPPTSPLTAITNTSLLCNFTNAGIYDATSKNDLETVGNAQISTTQSKFGGSSMYFDGTGDWLAIPATQNIVFGTADFTIEMWVYSGAQSGTGVRMMGNGAGGSWASGKYILTTTTAANPNKFTFGVNNTSPVDLLVSTTTFNDSTWRHVAITRYGNVFRLFVNGIQESTNTSSASVDNGTAVQIRIGSGGISGDADWAGYIDDLRITKGIARYTSNFTPPTVAFPLL